jgi:hypothetical protein
MAIPSPAPCPTPPRRTNPLTNKMQQRLMLRRRSPRCRDRRHRPYTLALTRHHQPQAIVVQRTNAIRVPALVAAAVEAMSPFGGVDAALRTSAPLLAIAEPALFLLVFALPCGAALCACNNVPRSNSPVIANWLTSLWRAWRTDLGYACVTRCRPTPITRCRFG